ncbi:MAG: hypothetical protein RLZZ360_729 [Candidatus Parcubacteria bacterium]|jgi:hypothetical protein
MNMQAPKSDFVPTGTKWVPAFGDTVLTPRFGRDAAGQVVCEPVQVTVMKVEHSSIFFADGKDQDIKSVLPNTMAGEAACQKRCDEFQGIQRAIHWPVVK